MPKIKKGYVKPFKKNLKNKYLFNRPHIQKIFASENDNLDGYWFIIDGVVIDVVRFHFCFKKHEAIEFIINIFIEKYEKKILGQKLTGFVFYHKVHKKPIRLSFYSNLNPTTKKIVIVECMSSKILVNHLQHKESILNKELEKALTNKLEV